MNLKDRENRTASRLRALYDYTMGILWTAIGIVFLFHEKIGLDLKINDKVLTTIFGVSCLMYGIFRIYRGYRKT
jgi:uncharacterized membrane protein HdeD (DUF308 family)